MVNRKEFEADQEPEEVGRGQVIRVRLHTEVSDSTGFVLKVEIGYVFIGIFLELPKVAQSTSRFLK